MFSPRYTPQLNDDGLIVIEDIIELYKAGGINLSHKDTYAGIITWQVQRCNAIDWQIDNLYPKEVKAVLYEFQKEIDNKQNKRWGPIYGKRRDAARELTERMVQEHYSAHDQFTFMMAVC